MLKTWQARFQRVPEPVTLSALPEHPYGMDDMASNSLAFTFFFPPSLPLLPGLFKECPFKYKPLNMGSLENGTKTKSTYFKPATA